jgi:hypothetical protein
MTKSRGIGTANNPGRPPKYRPEMCLTVDAYLAGCVTKIEDYVKSEGTNSTSYQRIVKPNIPKLEEFAGTLGVVYTTILEWEKLYPDFHKVLDQIREAQEKILIEGGLSGDFNPMITKLILSAKHGYRERSDVTSDDQALQLNKFENYKE